jgi:hypothetical protein
LTSSDKMVETLLFHWMEPRKRKSHRRASRARFSSQNNRQNRVKYGIKLTPSIISKLSYTISPSAADPHRIFRFINVYVRLIISQKKIPLNSTDDVFMYEYFISLSDKITTICDSIRQSPGVQDYCPKLNMN